MIPIHTIPCDVKVGKPRASGDDPVCRAVSHDWGDVNPARAGMILMFSKSLSPVRGKPRASGDDPDVASNLAEYDA